MITSLESYIVNEIEEKGPIPFVRFMEQALYAPGQGYYSSGVQKFGRDGDFITAPELSPLFSQCVARQCQQVLSELKKPKILEFGAGSGVMAVDILLTLEQLNCLPDEYCIIELSAELQSRQQNLFNTRAPHLLSKVRWISQLPEEPFEGVILANEVLDAMPVHKFKMQHKLKEAYVDYQDEQFRWHWNAPSKTLSEAISKLEISFPEGYESEINCFASGWIRSLSSILSHGLVLLIDYGFPRREYYHRDRSMGTIMCHYQHRSHADPLILVGQQDITAHVDFTLIAEAAVDCEFDVDGYTNQAAFLIDCGITELLEKVRDDVERFNHANYIKLLTSPSEMGELFKVMALTKEYDEPLFGFRSLDFLDRL